MTKKLTIMTYNVQQFTNSMSLLQGELANNTWARGIKAYNVIKDNNADIIILTEAFGAAATGEGKLNLAYLSGETPFDGIINSLITYDNYVLATDQVGRVSANENTSYTTGNPPWYKGYGTLKTSLLVINGGVIILVKKRIRTNKPTQLIYNNFNDKTWDKYSNKGAALVSLPEYNISIIGTHLQADEDPVNKRLTHATRLLQLQELKDFIKNNNPYQCAIIAGDFNVEALIQRPGEEAYRINPDLTEAERALGGKLYIGENEDIYGFTYDCTTNTRARSVAGEAYKDYRNVLDYIGEINNTNDIHLTNKRIASGDYANFVNEASDHYPTFADIIFDNL